MLTVHFKDRVERAESDPPFWHDASNLATLDPVLTDEFNYSEALMDSGFNGLVTVNKIRTSTVYENSFVTDENTYNNFLATVDADTRLKDVISVSQIYYNEHNITRTVEVKYFDENGTEVVAPL